MTVLGTVDYLGERFIFFETAFTKGSRQLVLLSEEDLTVEGVTLNRRRLAFYQGGGVVEKNYVLGILDPVRKKQYGSIPLLTMVYNTITDFVRDAKLAGNVEHNLGADTYTSGNNSVVMTGTTYKSISIVTDALSIKADFNDKIKVKPRTLGRLLVDMRGTNTTKFSTATFLDASLEYLQRQGFDTSWMDQKEYIPIHSTDDWDNKLIPALIAEFRRWKREKDFPYFVMSIDFESDGVEAFNDEHPNQSKAVYFSISFKDHQSFGVFVDMVNFTNADKEGIAERLTYLTQMDVLEDRDLRFEHNGDVLELKRSELLVSAHNMLIDRRFGMTMGADVWFNFCSMQLSFNLDTFMTKGINGLKHIVKKFFGIEYAELIDICGPKNYGMFKYLTDIRVIMMYGCADTDWHRLAVKRLIEICAEAKDYYGVDHAKQHIELDTLYMNSKADADYNGHRVNKTAFVEEYEEQTRILNLYYSFMAQYVGRVKAYNDYEKLIVNAERYGMDPKQIPFDNNPNDILVKSWSGKELLDVLFKTLNYPILAWTTQNKKAKMAGKPFTPKPAVNTEALKKYLSYPAIATKEQIEEAFKNPMESLENLKWSSIYLMDDYVDPKTGKVLIEKKKFNSHRLPFMYVLLLISPILKSISAELKPIAESPTEYRYAACNMTSAVTRRDLNPMQTVSKRNKYKYLPYTDDYYYAAVDQSAVEIRILDGLSGDKNLIEPLNNPEKDTHTETAALMYQQPAHTITKDVRKGVKELAFGIPYGKEIYSTCLSLFKEINPDNLAKTAYLFDLYKKQLASVMKVLDVVRDEMDVPVNPPQSLVDYLEFDPEKKYGRMINKYGYCQHLEIRDVEWFRQALRRKAGNFIIQGFAANLLRKIYTRLLKAFWAKGWIQNRMVRIHLTVHDEIDMSYHKSLNPVEVMTILHESLTVKMEGFPTFYVGINFGANWGESKADESELPVFLVNELTKQFKEGKFDNYEFGDHLQFFKTKRLDYYERRIKKELLTINENKNVWDFAALSDRFTNYTVRAYVPEIVKDSLFKVSDGNTDQALALMAKLPLFIAKYIVPNDSRKHYVVLDGKHRQITEELLGQTFASLDDFFAGKPIVAEGDEVAAKQGLSTDFDLELSLEDDFDDIILDEDNGFDFDDNQTEEGDEELAQYGVRTVDTGFLNSYRDFKDPEKEEKVFDSVEERVAYEMQEASSKLPQFTNFKVQNGKAIISLVSGRRVPEVQKLVRGKGSRSIDATKVFLKSDLGLQSLGAFDNDTLKLIDDYLSNTTKFKGVII